MGILTRAAISILPKLGGFTGLPAIRVLLQGPSRRPWKVRTPRLEVTPHEASKMTLKFLKMLARGGMRACT